MELSLLCPRVIDRAALIVLPWCYGRQTVGPRGPVQGRVPLKRVFFLCTIVLCFRAGPATAAAACHVIDVTGRWQLLPHAAWLAKRIDIRGAYKGTYSF